MCVEYDLHADQAALARAIGDEVYNKTGLAKWDEKFRLTARIPVLEIEKRSRRLILDLKLFPARPFPNSRLSDVMVDKKTGEIEVKRIYERPTWTNGFLKGHTIVPMTSFNESAYWGLATGASMQFSTPGEVLFAAAILIKPQTPPGDPFSGVSLLTHIASRQMKNYHHRLVVFLKPADALLWLKGPHQTALENFDWLLENRFVPEFKVVQERKMASGWKKRVDEHNVKLQEENKYEAFLKSQNVLG